MMASIQSGLSAIRAAEGRGVSSGSVFSTILLNHVVEANGSGRAEVVLDVGCGGSPYRELLRPTRYIGVDRTLRDGDGDVRRGHITGDVVALPVADDAFDGVICTEVIEHVVDERLLAAELARVARPGAVLVLSSPYVHGLHEQPFDYRRLTSIGLRSVLEEAGWTVERMVSVGGPLVVGVDSTVRSVDSFVRAAIRRLLGRGSPALGLATTLSARIQQVLAVAALASPLGRFGPIDPGQPSPRLTLGYVVIARRSS